MKNAFGILALIVAIAAAAVAYDQALRTAATVHSMSNDLAVREMIDEELRGEHVINPPADGRQYATILLTSDSWQTNFEERRLVAWFETNEKLRSLKSTTVFVHYTPSHKHWRERFGPAYHGSMPMVRLQDWDGAVYYEESGHDLPVTDAALVSAIQTRLGQCRPWNRPDVKPSDKPRKSFFELPVNMAFDFGELPSMLGAIAIFGLGLWNYLTPKQP